MEIPCEYKYYARKWFYKSVEFSMALKLRAACYKKKKKEIFLVTWPPTSTKVGSRYCFLRIDEKNETYSE